MANFLDFIFGPSSPEIRGVLDPEQQRDARRRSLFDAGISMLDASESRGFGGTLAAGLRGGRESYGSAIANQMSGDQYAQQQQLANRRNEISNRYRMQPGEAPEATDNRLRLMMAEYLQIGDTESAGKISEYLKSRGGADAKQPGTWVTIPGPDGKPMRRYVTAEEAGQTGIPEYVAPRQPSSANIRPVSLQTPNGPRVYLFDPNTGRFTDTGRAPATNREQPTDAERKAELLRQTMEFAMPQLDSADAPSRIEKLARDRSLNEVLKAEEQKNMIAGLAVAEAWLRLTSGAAITEGEIRENARMVVPLPGDSPETIAYKRQLRAVRLRALQGFARRATAAGSTTSMRPTLDELEEGL